VIEKSIFQNSSFTRYLYGYTDHFVFKNSKNITHCITNILPVVVSYNAFYIWKNTNIFYFNYDSVKVKSIKIKFFNFINGFNLNFIEFNFFKKKNIFYIADISSFVTADKIKFNIGKIGDKTIFFNRLNFIFFSKLNSLRNFNIKNIDDVVVSNLFLKTLFLNNLDLLDTVQNSKNSVFYNVNNFTNINYLSRINKKLIYNRFQKNSTPKFYKYFYNYITSFFELFLKKKILLNIKTKLSIKTFFLNEISAILIKHKSFQSKIGRGFFFSEMLEILFLSFFYKDLNLLINWFIKTMGRIQFKNHKKFLNLFKFTINSYSKLFVYANNVSGFFFDIRGKVGVSGNAKKRHFSFNEGEFSKTTKNSKFEYQHQIVRTFTGALGVTMILYY